MLPSDNCWRRWTLRQLCGYWCSAACDCPLHCCGCSFDSWRVQRARYLHVHCALLCFAELAHHHGGTVGLSEGNDHGGASAGARASSAGAAQWSPADTVHSITCVWPQRDQRCYCTDKEDGYSLHLLRHWQPFGQAGMKLAQDQSQHDATKVSAGSLAGAQSSRRTPACSG